MRRRDLIATLGTAAGALPGVTNEAEIESAFDTIVREQPDALLVLADRLFLHNRERIMDFAAQQRLPGVHAYRELVEAGGLMSYRPPLNRGQSRATPRRTSASPMSSLPR